MMNMNIFNVINLANFKYKYRIWKKFKLKFYKDLN